jgi:DNA-binding NtrC family response regulator
MPDLSGLEVVRQAKEIQPEVAVVVLTAFGSVGDAVAAMKAGAEDYLTKPVDLDELDVVVARILERSALVRENRILRRRLDEAHAGFRLLGRAAALQEVLARASRAAETDAVVLIRGESGTGKELLARSIHALGRRAEGPFVAVNCAALPETLLESELFGHEKGAFTGADTRRAGRVERARGGTLFLDEIGDIAPLVQIKLLRFLQDREFSRLGSDETLRADVRVIAATHRDLEEMIASGSFREDLYYRLNVISLRLPPLRERREDIPELAEHFLGLFARRYDRPRSRLSHEAMDALLKHPFPGNVRELENILEQAVVLARGDVITRADLPATLRSAPSSSAPAGAAASAAPAAPAAPAAALSPEGIHGNLGELLEEIEKRVVLDTLRRYEGNQSSAARHLGLTESGLRYKLKKWQDGA